MAITEDNRISASITDADITTILGKIQDVDALVPFAISIPNQERQEVPKMGDKSVGFDDKCAGYMASNPEFIPGFVDMAEVAKDRVLRAQLLKFLPQLRVLVEKLEDTALVVNSEIWMADLAFYQAVREARKRGRAGADTIYNDLRPRFPGRPTQPQQPNP